jgi:hypothetical protein
MNDQKRPLILSLDTSTRGGGIALLRGNALLAGKKGDEKKK